MSYFKNQNSYNLIVLLKAQGHYSIGTYELKIILKRHVINQRNDSKFTLWNKNNTQKARYELKTILKRHVMNQRHMTQKAHGKTQLKIC